MNDIKVFGNNMTGRQGYAYTYNSMRYPVLVADVDKEQKYAEDGYNTFGNVRVEYEYKGNKTFMTCTLEAEKGKWSLGYGGTCLHSSFTFNDMMELVNNATSPVVRKDQVVVISLISKKNEFVINSFYRVGALDRNCVKVAELIPLTDEEMREVEADAHKWCNR